MDEARRQLESGDMDMVQLAKIAGGGFLVLYGLSRGTFTGLGLAAAGGGLLYAGQKKSDGQPDAPTGPMHVRHSISVYRPVETVYSHWRDLEQLPQFLDPATAIVETGQRTSHWFLSGPAGIPIRWDAVVTEERENEFIRWESSSDSDVEHSGTVRFRQLPTRGGTEIHVDLQYTPPGGMLGEKVARMLGDAPTQWVHRSLNRFKHLLETGVLPTTDGQPRGPGGTVSVEGLWGIGRQLADAARTIGAR